MDDSKAPFFGHSGQEGNPRHKIRLSRSLLLAVGLIFVVVLAVWLLLREGSKPEVTIPEIKVAVADTSRIEVYGEYDGRIRPSQFVEVHARVEGYLEKMLFKEGTYVRKGQTLFVIDPGIYQANVDRARAQLKKARAMRDKAERDLNRISPLYAQKAASQLDLDNAEAAVEYAKADVAVCEADLRQAELTLSYTRVVSPISGYISESKVDVGALVGPSGGESLLATIVRSDSVMIDFSMTPLDYLRSKDRHVDISGCDDDMGVGKLPCYVTLTLADGSEYPYRGRVDFANPQGDDETGAYSLRADMPNPDKRLLPGEATKVKVLLDVLDAALTVPSVAVQESPEGAFVYVVSEGETAERRPVVVGPVSGDKTVIGKGLSVGEKVAVSGIEALAEAVKVKEAGK